jgi:hypothetical protein
MNKFLSDNQFVIGAMATAVFLKMFWVLSAACDALTTKIETHKKLIKLRGQAEQAELDVRIKKANAELYKD